MERRKSVSMEKAYVASEMPWFDSPCCALVVSRHFQQIGNQPAMVAYPACDQLKRENDFFLSPFVPKKLVSRERYGRPVQLQPAHFLHTQGLNPMHMPHYNYLYLVEACLVSDSMVMAGSARHTCLVPNVFE